MEVHIRTKINTWWSFIETAVIKIGNETLEVTGGIHGGSYWLNGKTGNNLEDGATFIFSNLFEVKFHQVTSKQKKYRIDFGHGDSLGIATYKDFVSVNVMANKPDNYMGAVGLMGKLFFVD